MSVTFMASIKAMVSMTAAGAMAVTMTAGAAARRLGAGRVKTVSIVVTGVVHLVTRTVSMAVSVASVAAVRTEL